MPALCEFSPRRTGPFRYAGRMQEEIAPPPEHWDQHLKALSDRDLAAFACDYRWLDEEARAEEERGEFRRRREAIIAECERRGIPEASVPCRRPAMGGSGR